MKTLRLSCLLAILFAFVTLFMSCDPVNPPDPGPGPDPVKIDSVIIEVSLVLPPSCEIVDTQINYWNGHFTDGILMKIFTGNDRVKRMIFVNEDAKALIGKSCGVDAGVRSGWYNGNPGTFTRVSEGIKNIVIQKGLNRVSFDFTARN